MEPDNSQGKIIAESQGLSEDRAAHNKMFRQVLDEIASRPENIHFKYLINSINRMLREGLIEAQEIPTLGEIISDIGPRNVKTAAFNERAYPELSVPQGGLPIPYPGKRSGGDVRQFLLKSYPRREGAEPLTLGWLEKNDSKAFRALYRQSTEATGHPTAFLPGARSDGDEFLAQHNINLASAEGLEKAMRLYGLLGSRLYPKAPSKKRK